MTNTFGKASLQRTVRAILIAGLVMSITFPASAQITAKIEKVWLEHDVRVKGELGVRVHVKYSMKNARGVPCSLQVYGERADGKRIYDGGNGKNKYANRNGLSVITLSTFTPPFDATTYPDSRLFFPYWVFNLRESDQNRIKLSVRVVGEGKEFARTNTEFARPFGKALP